MRLSCNGSKVNLICMMVGHTHYKFLESGCNKITSACLSHRCLKCLQRIIHRTWLGICVLLILGMNIVCKLIFLQQAHFGTGLMSWLKLLAIMPCCLCDAGLWQTPVEGRQAPLVTGLIIYIIIINQASESATEKWAIKYWLSLLN